MRWVLSLAEVGRGDIALAGGKGANLGELVRAGFPVPPGFVVTTQAYDLFVDQAQIAAELQGSDGERLRALFDRPIPDDLAAAIADAYAALTADTPGIVAVRSSATAEDLADASFAGQQDTFLGVSGSAAVLDAVRRCWASLWTDRAIAYRAKAEVTGPVRLAVVVQRLIDADAAGVLFTANPANGRRSESVINAAWGLGEAIVGGAVTPDEIVVGDTAVLRRTTADKAVRTVRTAGGTRTTALAGNLRRAEVLDDAQALALATLGRQVEDHFGTPQDIEWALAGGELWLTQSRPITALPAPTGPAPTSWPLPRDDGMFMRASIVEQLPDPLSPLFADLIRPAVCHSLALVLTRYFGESALRAGDIDFLTVNGYGYYFYSSRGLRHLMLLAPGGMRVVFGGSDQNGVVRWREEGLPTYRGAVAAWSGRDPATLSAAELLRGAEALVTAGADYYTYVQAVIPQAVIPEIVFTRLYAALVPGRPGVNKPPVLTFLLGFESAPIRAERSLFRFAQWCRETPAVAEAVLGRTPVPAAYAEEFEQKLADHLAQFGHLTYNLDVMQPVAADDPAPVLAALAHAVSGQAADPDARLAHLASERQRAEAWLVQNVGAGRRQILHRWLTKAHRLGPLREDALADIGLGWPTARRLLLDLGARLSVTGLVAGAQDVFWLTQEEARVAAAALDAGRPLGPSVSATIAQRQEIWRGRRLVSPPGWLPEGGFYYRLFKRWMPSNEAAQTGPTLTGLGASAGQATGPARLLLGPEDFSSMRPGEVLVAPITTPAYTPFFAMAAAVVTDVGGPLSHSSIVAREYGIPAVLGTGSATRRIRTGDLITVDGERGVVLLPS